MNCTKCGKEIPEGENKVCDECQKKVLDDIVSSENEKAKETPKKEEKFKVSKNGDEKKKSGKIKIIVIIILLVIIAGIGYVEYSTGKISSILGFSNYEVGSTIGNIRNYGYAVTQKEWIYYLSPDEKGEKIGIFKVKTDGTDKQQLFMSSGEVVSLNIKESRLYFIVTDVEGNKICSLQTDGTDYTVLNVGDMNEYCYEIYVVNDYIYYIGVDSHVYKMGLKGEDKTLVIESGTGYLGITSKYIVYNKLIDEEEADYVTCIANLDGTNERPIVEGKRLYSVNIENNYVYYTNEDKHICKVKIDDSSTDVVLAEITAYNMNVLNGYIYFMNYVDIENEDYTVGIYKIKIDGTEKEGTLIKTLESYSSFINVIGDWIIYLDSTEETGFINLVKIDGSKTIELYRLDFSLLGYDDLPEIEDEDIVEEETISTENTNVAEETTNTNTNTADTNTNTTDENTNVVDTTNEVNTTENTNTN